MRVSTSAWFAGAISRMPLESEQILRTQRARIDDPDRLRQFDFISRAAVSDTARLDTLFNSLLAAENRRIGCLQYLVLQKR